MATHTNDDARGHVQAFDHGPTARDDGLTPTPTNNLKKEETLDCGCKSEGRALIVCFDGTSNQFGEYVLKTSYRSTCCCLTFVSLSE
jgi:hypothetical protein